MIAPSCFRIICASALSLAVATGATAAAFQNGGFEQPTLTTPPGVLLPSGSTNITGWVTGGPGEVSFVLGHASGINPAEGSQQIDFNGGDTITGATLSQTFDTVAGQTYQVSFAVGRAGPGDGTMRLLAQVTASGGPVLGSLEATGPVSPGYGPAQAFSFTATTTVSTLIFTDTSSATIAVDLLLDNVSVTPASPPPPPVGPFVNGSFELPALAPDESVELPAGSTTVTGWTVGNAGVVSWRNGPAYGVAPVDGLQEIGFNGGNTPPGGSISQTFSTTIGQTYEVRFNVGRHASGSGTMRLLAEVSSSIGAGLGSLTAEAPSTPGYGPAQAFSFTATTTASTLTFTDTSTATIAVDLLLDNVRVESGTGSCLTPPSGLVHWWPGQGNANDVAGDNNGTLQNGAAFASGKVGQSFSFDGVDDSVSFGNTVGNFDTNDFTVEFWIRTTATRLESVIEKWPVCGVSSMWNIRIGGPGPGSPFPGQLNTEMFSDSSGNDHNVIVSTRAINDGVFHHVALVRRGLNIAYYIDGIFDVSSNSAGGVTRINNDADTVAGRGVCVGIDGTSPFTGQMDEISVYNRALAASEVEAIFHAGSAGKCPPPQSECVPPASGLLAWWRGEENVLDDAGENDGALVGGVSFASGKVGQTFSFDGTGEVRVEDSPELNVQTFAIEAWVYPTALDGEMEVLVYKEADGPTSTHPDPRQYAMAIKGPLNHSGEGNIPQGNLAFAILGINGLPADEFFGWVNGGGAVPLNQWTHVALTFDGTRAKTYINGALARAIDGLSGNVNVSAGPLKIGSRSPNILSIIPQERFNGRIDELSLYSRALSAAEIAAIHGVGSAGKCPPECLEAPAGLISWLSADGNAVDVVDGTSASLVGGVFFAGGKVGQGFNFDGTGEVRVEDSSELNVQTFAIEAWVYPTALDGEMEVIVYKEADGPTSEHPDPRQYALTIKGPLNHSGQGSIPQGNLAFAILGINGLPADEFFGWVNGGGAVPLNQWTHVALTFDGTRAKTYINGALARAIDGLSGNVNVSAGPLKIGSRSPNILSIIPQERFNGRIDEFSLYSRALSAAEIAAIHGVGSAGKCPPGTPTATSIAHWKFDETDGTVAHDSAGTYHGNLSSTGAAFVAGGISGNAMNVSWSSNGFVNMGNVLGMGVGDFAVALWVKTPAGDTTPHSLILSKHETGYANGYFVGANTSFTYGQEGKAYFYDSAFPGQEVRSTSNINDGNWHHVVGVYELGGNKSIYVDGTPVEAANPSLSLVNNSAPFLIGGVNREGHPTSAFTGMIDDVQIYSFALSSSNVDYLFQNPGDELRPQDVPVGEWRLTTVAGAGGTITRNPDLAKYTNGATVTVTAVPNSGFAFTSWSGDASGTTNPITITMNGNKTVTAGFREIPVRTLFVVNPEPRQEGEKIHLDLKLISPGDVGGMNFILRYNPQYLKEPKLDWSSAVGSALDQVNYDTPGQIRATFALPATAISGGTQRVATVSFRTRSVPSDLSTDLGLELVDVSSPTGDSIRNGNLAQGGSAQILVRRIIGDNNANDRLDVGDATIIQRLLIRLDPVRAWDITGNDLNANTSLDSGDAVKVLRVVADLDPQPSPAGGAGPARVSGSRNGLRKAGPVSENIEISLDKTRAQPGELVTAQVRLKGISSTLAGASFALEFPTNALRLVNAQSQKTGPLVPASAFTVWNVTPAQNNYTVQDGRVSVGISTPTVWSTNNGVLAEFTFEAQPEQAGQYRWPIGVEGMEVTENGYETQLLGDAEAYYVGRDPIPPTLTSASVAFSPNGLSLTLSGEIGVPYAIEVSNDLVTWTSLTTLTATDGTLSFVDSDARNFTHRFYRAKQQ